MKTIKYLLSIFSLFLLWSCNLGIEEITRKSELLYITLDTENAITDYTLNSSFDESSTGIKVIGHYSDNTENYEDIRLITYDTSEFNSEAVKENIPITVYYEGFSDVYYVNVAEKTLDSIKILNYPKKIFYKNGDEDINLEGIYVQAIYNNGDTEIITDTSELTPSVVTLSNCKFFTIGYMGKTDSFYIEDIDYEETNLISITYNEPSKAYIKSGTSVSRDDITVTIGNSKQVSYYHMEPYDFSDLQDGENKFTIMINNSEDSFTITLADYTTEDFFASLSENITNKFYTHNKIGKNAFSFSELLSNEETRIELSGTVSFVESEYYDINEDDSITLNNSGIIPVNFKYEVTNQDQTEFYAEVLLYVLDPYITGITATWEPSENVTYIPLGVDVTSKTYGSWYVYYVLNNGEKDTDNLTDSCNFSDYISEESTFLNIYDEIINSDEKTINKDITISYSSDSSDGVTSTYTCTCSVPIGLPN